MAENDSPEREIHRTPLKLPANGSELRVTAYWAATDSSNTLQITYPRVKDQIATNRRLMHLRVKTEHCNNRSILARWILPVLLFAYVKIQAMKASIS